MFPGKDRLAIGRTSFVLLVIVVVVVGGAVGISYPKPAGSAPATSTAASTSSTATTSSQAGSNTTSVLSQTLSAPLFDFIIASAPPTILISPGATLTYATVSIVPTANRLVGAGLNEGLGGELVVLNATVPSGLSLRFFGSALADMIYLEASPAGSSGVYLELAADQNEAPGDYEVAMQGSSGSLSVNYSFTVRVVQYMVVIKDGAFQPNSVNVKVGSTVYWMNLNQEGNMYCVLAFDSIGVRSPVLIPNPHYDWFSYTFKDPGTYAYNCQSAQTASGTITVAG